MGGKKDYLFTLNGIDVYNILEKYNIKYNNNSTSIEYVANDKPYINFLDNHKVNIHSWICMQCNNNKMPLYTNIKCWWCRNNFNTSPIGIPISHYIKKDNNDNDIHVFEVEGNFCSFSCCKAYLLQELPNVYYKNSISLLSYLYKLYFNKTIDIEPSPSWKLLKEYGGVINITEYRDKISKFSLIENNHKNPILYVNSLYIEEK